MSETLVSLRGVTKSYTRGKETVQVLEALDLYRTRKNFRPGKLMEYARICRVANVMAPYLEAKL